MAIVDVAQDGMPDEGPLAPAARRPRRRFRLGRSKKMVVGLVLLGFFVVLAIIGPIVAPYDPKALGPLVGPPLPGSTVPSQLPGAHHWLGQTNIGGDVLSQLLAGTRPTMMVSFLAGAIATSLAIIIGITAGYLGGIVDEVLSLIANVFLVIPALPLLIAIGAFLGPDRTANPLVVGVIIALTGWAWGARVLRAQALSMRSREFVEAARISGESTWRIIMAEIMPNLTPVIASSFLFTTIYAIGTYVGLGFLSVVSAGADYNWGTILFDATTSSAVESGFWWWYIPPGIAIALLGTSLALINFGIDEFINPRLRTANVGRKARKRIGFKLRPQLGFTPVVRERSIDAQRRASAGLEET
ncbi:MAG: peptide/nickel transport system permease protein, partial [Actinomycetota bacterium]|nr:peptide/nickel transport system permease protein [Actinomycetota bacterium]